MRERARTLMNKKETKKKTKERERENERKRTIVCPSLPGKEEEKRGRRDRG